MSRSPSTTITRLRFISPGPAPHAATEAKVGTTFRGRGVKRAFVDEGEFLLVHRVGAHADAVGVEHHLAIAIGVFLAEIFQGHQLFVLDRHFGFSPEFIFVGASCCALSPCESGLTAPVTRWVRVYCDPRFRGDDPYPVLRAHLLPRGEGTSTAGVKNGSGAPSVGLNTTFTFWPIFSFVHDRSRRCWSAATGLPSA